MIIAIDGPAGVGKSSSAKLLANRLGIHYFDSGAVYRALAFDAYRNGGLNFERITYLTKNLSVEIRYTQAGQRVLIEGEDITPHLRIPEITDALKKVASTPLCRELVNRVMKDCVGTGSYVIDGRDIGTVVFPNADYKFYLDASPHARVVRRAKELGIAQDTPEFVALKASVEQRDQDDKTRAEAPLRKADDAVLIITDDMDMPAVVSAMADKIRK